VQDNSILEDISLLIRKNSQRIKYIKAFIISSFVLLIVKLIATLLIRNHYSDIIYQSGDIQNFQAYIIFNGIFTILYYLSIAALGISFVLWFSRAYFNLERLKVDLKFKAIFSSISWFIPIVNFVLPYLIFKDLILKSEKLIEDNSKKKVSGNFDIRILQYWWIFFCLGSLIPIVQYLIVLDSMNSYYIDHSSMLNAYIISISSIVFYMVSLVFLYLIITNFQKIEEETYEDNKQEIEIEMT